MWKVCVFVLCFVQFSNAEIPSYIHVCKASNPDLGGCITESINSLMPILGTGIPELQVPRLQPFDLGDLYIRSNMNFNMTNIILENLLPFEILELSASFEKLQFAFVFKFNQFQVNGEYAVDSKLLSIPLQGHGALISSYDSVKLIGKLKGKRIERAGKSFVELRFLEFKITNFQGTKFSLNGLFPDNKQLAEAAFAVIQDNAELILEEIIPTLEESLNQKITLFANKIVSMYSEDEIFPK